MITHDNKVDNYVPQQLLVDTLLLLIMFDPS
jgi:hypothetical protein